MATPGVSLVNSMKLRPLFGNPSTAFWSMRVAPSVRAVSMSGDVAVTTISSAVAACLSAIGTVSVWPTPRSRPFCTTVAKP